MGEEINLTMVGHSYTRRLRDYRNTHEGGASSMTLEGKAINLTYVHQGGQNYAFFNRSEVHKRRVVESKPDVVLVVLGGNAVGSGAPVPTGTREMRRYHRWLREALPGTVIICAEVEPRYNPDSSVPEDKLSPLDPDRKHRETYWYRRNAFNQAVNRMKDKDFTLRIGKYLNRRRFYDKSGVHLSRRGNRFYWGLIKDCLVKAFLKFQL